MANTRKHFDLHALYQAVNLELEHHFQGKQREINSPTYNYLRSVRNNVVKLMVLWLQYPASVSQNAHFSEKYSRVLEKYLDPDQYSVSAPLDRHLIVDYQDQLKKQPLSVDDIDQELQKNLATLFRNLRWNQTTQTNIQYSNSFNKLLARFEKQQAPLLNQDLFRDDLLAELHNRLEMHGQAMSDADLSARKLSPYTRLGEQLKIEISQISAHDSQQLLKTYMAMQAAVAQLAHFLMKSTHFNNLGLEKFLTKKMGELEKNDPSLKKSALQQNANRLNWQAYEMRINTGIHRLEVLAQNLQPVDPAAAQKLQDLADKMRVQTKSYFGLSIPEREKGYSDYSLQMQKIGSDGLGSSLLNKHSSVAKAIKNILLVTSSLGLGLIWLKATEKRRGSFWLQPEAAPVKLLKRAMEETMQVSASIIPQLVGKLSKS